MSEHNQIPEPTELVYTPRPSWAPAFFALGLALAVCGIFSKFLVPSWVYSIFGLIILAVATWHMVSSVVSDFFGLPKRQRVRGAVLPASTLHVAHRDQQQSS